MLCLLKVRHLLERETEHLRDVWFKRISFSINIPCPCEKTCNLHGVSRCTDPQCVHLLSLDDCLTKKVSSFKRRESFPQRARAAARVGGWKGKQSPCPSFSNLVS